LDALRAKAPTQLSPGAFGAVRSFNDGRIVWTLAERELNIARRDAETSYAGWMRVPANSAVHLDDLPCVDRKRDPILTRVKQRFSFGAGLCVIVRLPGDERYAVLSLFIRCAP